MALMIQINKQLQKCKSKVSEQEMEAFTNIHHIETGSDNRCSL